MIVVTKTLEAKAGSIFNFFKETGTNIPNKPATIIFKNIETPNNNDKVKSIYESQSLNNNRSLIVEDLDLKSKKLVKNF